MGRYAHIDVGYAREDYSRAIQRCYREASERGWIDASTTEPFASGSISWYVSYIEDESEQAAAYYLESVATALRTEDPMLALRASLQVYEYHERMGHEWRCCWVGSSQYKELRALVRDRIERILACAKAPKLPYVWTVEYQTRDSWGAVADRCLTVQMDEGTDTPQEACEMARKRLGPYEQEAFGFSAVRGDWGHS